MRRRSSKVIAPSTLRRGRRTSSRISSNSLRWGRTRRHWGSRSIAWRSWAKTSMWSRWLSMWATQAPSSSRSWLPAARSSLAAISRARGQQRVEQLVADRDQQRRPCCRCSGRGRRRRGRSPRSGRRSRSPRNRVRRTACAAVATTSRRRRLVAGAQRGTRRGLGESWPSRHTVARKPNDPSKLEVIRYSARMDFDLCDEQRLLRDTVRDFARARGRAGGGGARPRPSRSPTRSSPSSASSG